MIKVSNTKTMQYILNSILESSYKYWQEGDKIVLDINMQQLMYAINSTGSDLQHVYGSTDEWKELTGMFKV